MARDWRYPEPSLASPPLYFSRVRVCTMHYPFCCGISARPRVLPIIFGIITVHLLLAFISFLFVALSWSLSFYACRSIYDIAMPSRRRSNGLATTAYIAGYKPSLASAPLYVARVRVCVMYPFYFMGPLRVSASYLSLLVFSFFVLDFFLSVLFPCFLFLCSYWSFVGHVPLIFSCPAFFGAKSHRFKSYSLDSANTLNVCYAIRIVCG